MKKNIQWVLNNLNKNEGIVISNKNRMSYPEVSGYYIPTLLNLGYKDIAEDIGLWLARILSADGSIMLGPNRFTFDTAMVLSGWQALGGFTKERALACKFLLSQINSEGRLSIDYHDHLVPEKILLWCANLLEKEGYDVSKVWKYYDKESTFKFDCLSHFHCYVLDATLNTPLHNKSVEAIKYLASIQRPDGSIPAYSTVNWVCYTGVAQAALLFYKIGLKENGDKAVNYVTTKITETGGILGSNGDYFPDQEISWAVKFYLDAYQMMIEKEMDKQCSIFPVDIDGGDCRVSTILKYFGEESGKVLDFGCGKGRFAKHLMNKGVDVYGMDISGKILEHSCIKSKSKGFITNTDLLNNTYDGVYSIEVFEHSPHLIENAFKEVARLLKPGARFVLIDKNNKINSGKEKWEEWFDLEEVKSLMGKYFIEVEAYKISDLFICWTGKRTYRFEFDRYEARKVLEETKTILNSNDINDICLFQGTLLGAYRDNNKFVSGDFDIDLILMNISIDRFNSLNTIFKNKGYKIREFVENKFISILKNNVIVDLQIGSFIDNEFVLESPVTIDKYPKYLFDKTSKIKLYNMEFLAPSNIEEYLKLNYGIGWNKPKINTDHDNTMPRIWKK